MTVDITSIVKAVLELIFAIAGIFLIPWLKEKIGAEKLAKIVDTIDILVAAAEQIANREGYDGAWKKQHVIEKLQEKGYTVDPTIDDYIEAAVIKLHNELVTLESV